VFETGLVPEPGAELVVEISFISESICLIASLCFRRPAKGTGPVDIDCGILSYGSLPKREKQWGSIQKERSESGPPTADQCGAGQGRDSDNGGPQKERSESGPPTADQCGAGQRRADPDNGTMPEEDPDYGVLPMKMSVKIKY
jgi:hypothetical protein